MPRHHARLRARIALGVLAGALVVATGVTLLLANTIGLRNGTTKTIANDTYTLQTVSVERLVIDAETGLRGYVITGQPLFLQPLRRAQALMPAAIAALERSAHHSRVFQPQVTAVVRVVLNYMGVYVGRALDLAAHHLRDAQSLFVTLAGKQLVDGIRTRTATLERLLSDRQAAGQRADRRSADQSIIEAIAVLVLLTLMTALLGGVLGHLAVERERARELSEATSVSLQESLVPTSLPAIAGCELASRFLPAAGLAGGDFFDVFPLGPNRWGLIIGDVCGKGAVAASITAMARWRLRGSLEAGAEPGDALRSLNEAMLRQGHDRRFVTVVCMTLSSEPEAAEVELACAGHPAPLFVPRDGPAFPVEAAGDLIGIMPMVRLESTHLRLGPGEGLVAFTDGVFDQGPELRPLPEDALAHDLAGANAEQLAQALETHALHHAGGHRDDVAILALRFVGGAGMVAPRPVLVTRATADD